MIRVTIWNEFRHEKMEEAVRSIYPNGLHAAIGDYLSKDEDIKVTLAALDDPCQGLPDELLDSTDVLIWWGHMAHEEVSDELVRKIQTRVYTGKMGFIALHSAHKSKPFRALVGTSGNLNWGREVKEIVWNMLPSHPIAQGIPEKFYIESEEIYAEPFSISQPNEVIFGGWYEDGYIFRSGMTFLRDCGKIFYFQPGHEYCPTYYNPYVLRVIKNAVHWAAPLTDGYMRGDLCPHICTAHEYEKKKAAGKLNDGELLNALSYFGIDK